MDRYTRLINDRKERALEQLRRDALTRYLDQGYSIERAMRLAGYQQETSRK
jgi:hypothetical protein